MAKILRKTRLTDEIDVLVFDDGRTLLASSAGNLSVNVHLTGEQMDKLVEFWTTKGEVDGATEA